MSKTIEINEGVARRCLRTVDAGLVNGLGVPVPGQMCVEAAINYALGLPHGDKPSCVDTTLRAFKIKLNDSPWSSRCTRAAGMRRLALAQLGSAGELDSKAFVTGLVRLSIGKWLPAALRGAASTHRSEEHKKALIEAAALCENSPTRANALNARSVAHAASATDAYAASAAASAYSSAAASAYAASAAASAYSSASATASAYAAAYASAAVYAAASAADAAYTAKDATLAVAAEDVVQLLIELKAPGCQWLYLTEEV